MARKKGIDIEIDKLTNSIVNTVTSEVFETEFAKVTSKEIKKINWLFDWHIELKNKNNEVYKMTTVENKSIIQSNHKAILNNNNDNEVRNNNKWMNTMKIFQLSSQLVGTNDEHSYLDNDIINKKYNVPNDVLKRNWFHLPDSKIKTPG